LVDDETTAYAQLNLQGPASRGALATLTDADLSTEAWPFRGVREIDVAGIPVTCARITYLGELGYELYVSADRALDLYDALAAAEGVKPVGLKALASLRMEKAYRDFGHDIDNTDCPLDVGLGFAVAWDTDFRGREALLDRKAAFPSFQRLVQLKLVDPEPLLYHAEPVLRNGEVVGYVRAASYGWTLGASVGLAFVSVDVEETVTKDWLDAGSWAVDIAGDRYAAEVSLRPMYDPTSARVRG
jgi:glycine cleavage system aminomethyltransferase T